MTAADYDSLLMTYSYSLDGGATFSPRVPWPGCNTLSGEYKDTFPLTIDVPDGMQPTVILRAYNMYDIYTDSAAYQSPGVFLISKETSAADDTSADTDQTDTPPGEEDTTASGFEPDLPVSGTVAQEPVSSDSGPAPVSLLSFLQICIVLVILLFIILLLSQIIARLHKRKRAKQAERLSQSRKVPGENRYHKK